MSAQGPHRVNRHGIPLRGDPPAKCAWPRCSLPSSQALKVHLCQMHADLTYNAVKQQRDKIIADRQAVLDRITANSNVQPPKRDEVIYYVQVGGHIKIGWTGRLEQRMRSYPPNSVLLALHPGSRADERTLHKRFAVHRSHGHEWYPLVPVILDHIKRVVAEHGQPPAITFGARPVEVRITRPKSTLQAKYGPMTVS